MIRDSQFWRDFEDELCRRSAPDHLQNIRLLEAMLEEARRLGVWPTANPLEGIEVDLRIARALHVHGST